MKPAGEGGVVVTPEVAAEAAVWVARLHAPDRTSAMEREFLAWQARSASNRLAFERSTDTWQDAAGAGALYRASAMRNASTGRAESASVWRPRPWMAALATVVLAGVLLLKPLLGVHTYETGVGEQRLVVLDDGSRLSLNTGTRVRVSYSSARRDVELQAGEALFEVAKAVDRPFAVRAGDGEVLATGTAFAVQLIPKSVGRSDLAVTLIEGSVEFRGIGPTVAPASGPRPIAMSPGERLRVMSAAAADHRAGTPAIDRPRIDQVIAWKRGEAVFDNLALAEAVAEMNRYSVLSIRLVPSPMVSQLRISGTFKVGDNAKFAKALVALYSLDLRTTDVLELSAR